MDIGIDAIINRPSNERFSKYTAKTESELEKGMDSHGSFTYLPERRSRPNGTSEYQGECNTESITSPPISVFSLQENRSDRSSVSTTVEGMAKTEEAPPQVPKEPGIDHLRDAEQDSFAKSFKILANDPHPVEKYKTEILTNASFSDSPCADWSESESESEPDFDELSLATRQFFFSLTVTGVFRHRLMRQLTRILISKIRGIREGSFRECTVSSDNPSPNNSSTPTSSTKSNTNGTTSQDKATGTKKRQVDGDNGDDGQDDEGGGKRSRREPPKPSVMRANRARFSCPYYKLDPQSFGPRTAHSFCGGTWPDISKLK